MAKTQPAEPVAVEPKSEYPAGVVMTMTPRQPNSGGPPIGHMGGYQLCGSCGALVTGDACTACTPRAVPSNISMSMPPKMIT